MTGSTICSAMRFISTVLYIGVEDIGTSVYTHVTHKGVITISADHLFMLLIVVFTVGDIMEDVVTIKGVLLEGTNMV